MIPWLIMAVVVVPLVVFAFTRARRSTTAAEHPATEDDATRARTEAEFAAAEAYEEQWREEQHKNHERDERFP
jgi:uncharacterized membrane protein